MSWLIVYKETPSNKINKDREKKYLLGIESLGCRIFRAVFLFVCDEPATTFGCVVAIAFA